MKETRFYLNMAKLSLAYRILQMINLMKIYFLIKIIKMRKNSISSNSELEQIRWKSFLIKRTLNVSRAYKKEHVCLLELKENWINSNLSCSTMIRKCLYRISVWSYLNNKIICSFLPSVTLILYTIFTENKKK